MDVNKTFKGACSVCLAAFLAFPMSSLPSVLAGISDSGDCSSVSTGSSTNSVSWEVDSETLKITGTGEMEDFVNSSSAPWYDNASTITSIVIEEGVTSIGNYAFCGLTNAQSATIPSSVKRIGVDAFKDAKCETEEDGLRYVGNWLTGFGSSLASEIEVRSGTVGIADFASADATVINIILPDSINYEYIGKNFLNGSNLENVYIDGTIENPIRLGREVVDIISNENVGVHFMVISNGDLSIEGLNETSVYHVGDRPTFNATLVDNAARSAPRCTIEEKWVSTDGTKEITAKNSSKFEKGVVYKYIIVVNPADKFSFDQSNSIVVNDVTLSEGILTFRQNFEALISIDSASLSESKNFDVSCNQVGTQPKFIEKVGTDANYSMTYQLWEKIDSSGKVEKRVVSGQYTPADSGVGALGNFEENGVYKYTVCLKPNEKYYFNPKFTATLGGKTAKVTLKEDGSVVLTLENLGTSHSFPLTKTDKVDPTCTTAGNKEYYKCPKCSKTFADENANEALTDIELPAKGHTFTKVEAVEPTCTKKGNIEYFKCAECGTYFESKDGQPGEEIKDKASVELDMLPHTFDESVFIIDGEKGHYHKCKVCDAHSETVAHTFDKKVEDEKYLKEGLTCGDVISYYKSCECGESSKGTKSEETFENEKGKKVEHEFGKDGVCTICKATDYKLSAVDGNTYTEAENGSLIFRANGSLDKLSSVKVDGTVLTKDKDYTVKSGSTIVELKNDYLKTLSAGNHTLTLVYEDGECEAKFDVKAADSKTGDDESKADDGKGSKGNVISDIIYKTGDNVGLISLVSTMLTSGLASVWFAKKRRKNR